ncbi:MAG: hypothetical protein M3Z14_00420 [Candidatus Eremiobacteraeota bacterium]|nr:hypothetical protein [Candidatus Eremiobacteraeota bacterium]
MMRTGFFRGAALLLTAACALSISGTPAFAAPRSAQHGQRVMPTPQLPKTPLHTEFVVEVNKLGQVVRVKSGKSCKDLTFNAQTYGNVLQMFIRTQDGMHAIVGLYRISYDYNPHTTKVHRGINLVSHGGNWADEEGAANSMRDIAERQAKRRNKPLPDFKQIVKPKTVSKP